MKALVELDPEVARVVERLKQTRADRNAEAEAEGALIGSHWAKETATARELVELAVEPWMQNWVDWRPGEDNTIWIALEEEEGPFARHERNVRDWRMTPYTRGVLRGASDVYEQVRDLI